MAKFKQKTFPGSAFLFVVTFGATLRALSRNLLTEDESFLAMLHDQMLFVKFDKHVRSNHFDKISMNICTDEKSPNFKIP